MVEEVSPERVTALTELFNEYDSSEKLKYLPQQSQIAMLLEKSTVSLSFVLFIFFENAVKRIITAMIIPTKTISMPTPIP
ncbi:MAG: hypothetical protein K2N53_02320, partial [Clostridia bacterium]|nr:hypothetical protein [Clostridia bacterium]